jgi:tetratricopeptide (TPR) repeat protein
MIGMQPATRDHCLPAALGLTIVFLALSISVRAAQQLPPQHPVVEALRLRENGDLTQAAQLLRDQLARDPDNGDAARLLAQTLYWLKEVDEARRVYNVAVARHPGDTAVRLEYSRMLLETGRREEARQILAPLQTNAATQADADTLLGTAAYWEGDLSAARRLFESALRSSPTHGEALRQLLEIRVASAPWIRLSSGVGRDDQPLDRLAFGIEGGWFATPLLPFTLRVQPATYRVNDASTRRLMTAEVEMSHFAPASRLETQLAGGLVHRWNDSERAEWTARAAVGVRLPKHLTLRAKAERQPYFSTTSSLESRISVGSGTALLHWEDPQGWIGEVAYQHQRFPDDNSIRSAYAWQLAPLIHRPRAEFQGGYAFARENADDSRFVLAVPGQTVPVSDVRFNTTGRYSPYYTPSHLVSHSLIAATMLRPAPQVTLRVRGGRALHASEDAPGFLVSEGVLQRVYTPRTFSPWNAHGSVEIGLNRRTTFSATGEYGRTAFYTWWTAGVGVTTRFRTTP